ncbi:MAG: precorrin-6A synthase (deacetylating) [Solirubrobacteraceae bacterium]|nr:precorrin-6A synthase (deacetylating) [Solirubrobacteraceae bacterium]
MAEGAAQDSEGRRVLIVGLGPGDPGLLTERAKQELAAFDVLFSVTRASDGPDLSALLGELVDHARGGSDYRTVELVDPPLEWNIKGDRGSTAEWRKARADLWEAAILEHLGAGQTGVWVIWGDPSIYESTLLVIQDILARGNASFDYEVIPGVSSAHTLAARHKIPLNHIGGPVRFTPGKALQAEMPIGADDVVVMLDDDAAFMQLDPADQISIYWGAYLGLPDEILISGQLDQVRDEIAARRAEARERKGWIVDTYLLRRFV